MHARRELEGWSEGAGGREESAGRREVCGDKYLQVFHFTTTSTEFRGFMSAVSLPYLSLSRFEAGSFLQNFKRSVNISMICT